MLFDFFLFKQYATSCLLQLSSQIPIKQATSPGPQEQVQDVFLFIWGVLTTVLYPFKVVGLIWLHIGAA